MNLIRVLGVCLIAALLVAACGGTEIAERIAEQAEGVENVDIQTDNGSVSIELETEEGTQSFSSGSELPDGFPFPVPDGFTVVGGGKAETAEGTSYSGVLTGPGDAFEDTVALYEQFLSGEGFEVSRFESSGGGFDSVTLGGMRDDVVASVTVGLTGGETSVTLGWSPS